MSRVRVLVVEDEGRMASLLRRSLQEEGYAVDVCRDGEDALSHASEHEYAAVVLDVMLPGDLDGFGVCRSLRAGGSAVPVLMLTARDAVTDRVAGLDAGADDYLVKPFSLVELAARLRALLRRGTPARPAELTVGTLRVDPAAHRAWRGDVEVRLTAQEFALLELFARHPGVVLTRDRILAHTWDPAYEAASNVVDQYVAYLRRKLDRPFGVEQLETLRGVGYRLREQAVAAAQPQR